MNNVLIDWEKIQKRVLHMNKSQLDKWDGKVYINVYKYRNGSIRAGVPGFSKLESGLLALTLSEIAQPQYRIVIQYLTPAKKAWYKKLFQWI